MDFWTVSLSHIKNIFWVQVHVNCGLTDNDDKLVIEILAILERLIAILTIYFKNRKELAFSQQRKKNLGRMFVFYS